MCYRRFLRSMCEVCDCADVHITRRNVGNQSSMAYFKTFAQPYCMLIQHPCMVVIVVRMPQRYIENGKFHPAKNIVPKIKFSS